MKLAVPEACLFVIFGARGDLARRKLIPALCRVLAPKERRDRIHILGVGTPSDISHEKFRMLARDALREAGVPPEVTSSWCDRCVHYHSIGAQNTEDYATLARAIAEIEERNDLPGNRVFYLALPPQVFVPTITALGKTGLNRGPGWTRVVVEKPFGRDLASAIALNQAIHEYFDESQVYRIDHYLGKETVQNLLVFRFANAVFESIWNRDRIESVQITVAEDLGVEHRGRYYEGAGALRDMVQNHLTQLLTMIAMEIPSAFDAEAIRAEKIKILRSLSPIRPEDVVFGQYGAGTIDGTAVPAYRDEPDVAPNSSTETFVALRLEVANWRWYGVPFFLRTGKRLLRQATEIVVRFRCPPVSIFKELPARAVSSNVLVITIQPDEGFELGFQVKAPGQPLDIVQQFLRFRYSETFQRLPEAYETLLLDVMLGDQTLFVWSEVAEAAWRIYAPCIDTPPPVHSYAAGTWGPAEADQLVARAGHEWLQP